MRSSVSKSVMKNRGAATRIEPAATPVQKQPARSSATSELQSADSSTTGFRVQSPAHQTLAYHQFLYHLSGLPHGHAKPPAWDDHLLDS